MVERHSQYDVKLTIRAANDVVFDTVNIIVSFENRSTNDIYLLDSKWRDPSSFAYTGWKLNLLFKDSISILYNPSVTGEKEEYILLKSGETYTFTFDMVFSNLRMWGWAMPLHILRRFNNGYGEYSIKLTYDPWSFYGTDFLGLYVYRGYEKVFRGTVESNEIRILNCEK